MEHYNTLFLQALKASLTNQKVDWTDVEPSNWQSLFRQSDIHHILPMIYESVFTCPAAGYDADHEDK